MLEFAGIMHPVGRFLFLSLSLSLLFERLRFLDLLSLDRLFLSLFAADAAGEVRRELREPLGLRD